MAVANAFPDRLDRTLAALAANEIDSMMTAYADDAVHEFPFAEGPVYRLTGHEAIAAYMGGLSKFVCFGTFSDIHTRAIGDETIVEAKGHHIRLPDERPFELSYIWFITTRDGLITHWREYINPLQLAPR